MPSFPRALRIAVFAAVGLAVGVGLAIRPGRAIAQAAVAPVETATSDVIDARWRESLEAFAAADRVHAPQPGGVVFVGSSSIRLWDGLETQFDGQPVVLKRGFGGSRLSDCARYLSRLVLPYKPRLVVLYAGDNDIAEGRSPQEVLASFVAFVEGVHKVLPGTRIAFVSIKPSPLREALLPRIREANALIAQYTATSPKLEYVDVFSRMVDADGHPRADLYSDDSLHLNKTGYALWRSLIGPSLLRGQASVDAGAPPVVAGSPR